MYSKQEKIEITEFLGKKLMMEELISKGCKDIIASGNTLSITYPDGTKETMEVKTQVPYFTENGVTFHEKDLEKYQSIDKLCFIVTQTSQKSEIDNKIYMINGNHLKTKDIRYYKKTVDTGRKSILIPLKQKNVNLYRNLTTDEKETFKKYTTTGF